MEHIQHAIEVLEFDHVLAELADCCQSEGGAALALGLRPSAVPADVEERLELTREAEIILEKETVPHLEGLRDLVKEVRQAAKGRVLSASDIYSIGRALQVFRQIRTIVRAQAAHVPLLLARYENLPDSPKTETRIFESVEVDGEILSTASPELMRLRKAQKSESSRLIDKIQSYTAPKYREMLMDAVYTTRNGRYVIPVRAEHKSKFRGFVHDTSSTGQTVFLEPEDVAQAANHLQETEAKVRAEEARILEELSSRIGVDGEAIATGFEHIAEWDLTIARARYGHEMRGVVPVLQGESWFSIQTGRHPMLSPQEAVPLSIELGGDQKGILITGPNTGGKTVALKTVGLFLLMAQCGIPVPATAMRFGVFCQIWVDIGDEQGLQQSLSTFSGHIKNIAEALRFLLPGALCIWDELGSGTDPAEGAALAKAILLDASSRGARILATSHYGELKVFAYNSPGFENAAMEFDLKSLRPTYRFMTGASGASHALKIAQRVGLSERVVDVAKEVVGVDQLEVSNMLAQLEAAEKRAHKAQSEADRLAHNLRKLETDMTAKLEEAKAARRKAREDANDRLDEALRELRLESARIFDELKKDRSQEGFSKARDALRDLQTRGTQAKFASEKGTETRVQESISKGDSVRAQGQTQTGIVVSDPRDGKAQVQFGVLKMTVPLSKLERVAATPAVKQPVVARKNLGLKKAQSMSYELNLIQMRAEQAENALADFIDNAILAGYPSARIVHGKGEGILRQMTHSFLKRHRGVAKFREGDPGEGGNGVTIAEFE